MSCSSLGGAELGQCVYLLECVDGGVHDPQFEHGSFREVAAFGCFPFVMLLDQDRPGKTQQGRRVGEHADDVGATFDLLVDPFDSGFVDQIWRQWRRGNAAKARRSASASVSITATFGWDRASMVVTSANCF